MGTGRTIELRAIAHARSGDKGDTCNIGLIANRLEDYAHLRRHVTAARVKAHFRGWVPGRVERFELPNIGALNFVLHRALGGGATESLRLDPQGKAMNAALLRMAIPAPETVVGGWGSGVGGRKGKRPKPGGQSRGKR